MENSYTRFSKSQTVSRHASTHDIKTSLKDIQHEYARALDQIQDLKSEKAHLKATLNQSLEERGNKSHREDSGYIEQFSQSFKSTFAKKAYLDAEKRVMELEEENNQLRKLIRRNGKKFVKLQEEILAYQYQVDKLGHLKLYNKNLQSEMDLLDQEFQNIVKRVDYLDDEKSQSQINQSLNIKNNKDFRESLTKYTNYIVKTVGLLDPKHYIRFHFEETFPSGSSLVNLADNREYSTLLLKSLKLVADLLPNNTDNDTSLHGLSPFSVGDITPQKVSPFQTLNDPIWSQVAEISPQTSQLLQTSITRAVPNTKDVTSSRIRSQTKPAINLQQELGLNTSTKKPRETQSSLSFGTRESKGQSIDMKAMESPRSIRSQHEATQRLDVFPVERPTINFPEVRTPTVGEGSACRKDDFESKTAAELELIQREKELIERERELMEKKKEYLMRSRELNESASEQRSYRERDGKSLNESSMEHGRIRSQKKVPTEIDEIREDEYDQRRSPIQLKSILKSSSSQMIVEPEKELIKRRKDDESSIMSASQQIRSAKDISTVLREKSKHLAKVLNKELSYENDLHSISKSEHDISIQRDAINRSREKSPVSSCKNFEEEVHETLRLNKGKSSDKILHEDYESHFGSNETSFATDKKSWFYPKNLNNQSKNNSNMMGSYYPISVEHPNRRESNESRKDETYNKKVSFSGQNQRTLEDQDSIKNSHHSQQFPQNPGQEQYQEQIDENGSERDRQQIVTFNPIRRFSESNNKKGTQYASFTVSFGRTESAERDPTSPVKYLSSIMDVMTKRKVDHLHQTYDVVKGEETYKRAIREHGSPQYKHTSDSQPSSRRARKHYNSEDYVALQTKSMVQQKDL